MSRLFILIKRKGAKRFKDAIPARKGISRSMLQKKVKKSLKAGLTLRIITESMFKTMLLRQARTGRKNVKVKKSKRKLRPKRQMKKRRKRKRR